MEGGESGNLKDGKFKLREVLEMKKVLVIGAGLLQSFVIRKAKAMGFETLAVDANPDAVGFRYADKYEVINIVDEEACLAYARKEKVDGVLTAATEYGVLTAAHIAREMGLPGLDYEVARLIKNKYRVRKCLYENQVDDTMPVYAVDQHTDIEALCKTIVFPVMVKPCDGSGSRGVCRVDRAADFEKACLAAMDSSSTRCAAVEPFIFGREYGAEAFVVNGEVHVLAIMRKWMTQPPYYAELGHGIPTDLPADVEDRARQCTKRAIQALGINFGAVNLDMIVTAEGKIHIIDVGARMGGNLIGSHIIPIGTGVAYIENMIKAHVGEEVDLRPVCDRRAVATRILALTPGVVEELPPLESKDGILIVHHLHLGDVIEEYHTNLDGCGYVVCIADTPIEAEMKAEAEKNRIDLGIKRKKNDL